mgnify:CR=1 FL=1
MEKMNGESMNLLNENIEKLKALFPEIVTDGKIDFDMLKTLLGEEVDASNEKYSFNWVGKRNCIKFAQTPSTGTLIPCKEKSVDFDNTQNIYIEGDNVEALKLLQKTYFGKIKMIYIDPPYNTGNDFVYHDDYKDSIENYKKITGQQATANPETNGRFHTDWLNMMYPRLKLAKDLLSDDGVIFISLDDNEAANIKKIGDEIFGESNFIGQITVVGNPRGRDYGGIARMHDYIFAYKKTSDAVLNLVEDKDSEFEMFDEFGGFELRELRNRNIKFNKENRPNLYYPFYIDPQNADKYGLHPISIKPQNGFIELYPLASQGINTVWRWGKAKSFENLNVNIMAKPMKNGSYMIVEKYRESKMMARSVWWDKKTNTENGTLLVKELMDGKVFDYPKPVEMLMRLCEMGSNAGDEECTILDFFSGSATTAHAVMQLNAEDGGNRKFIMVQLPELCDEKSEAYKAGYKTICDIGEERIRRAGAKIKEENPLTTLNLDTGFKVFRLDSTNIVPWNNAEKLDEMRLYDYAKTIKDDRDDLSVAYEIMLKYGVFDKPMKETVVSGKKMYDVGEGYMIICLADGVTMTDVEAIARLNPHCVVFKESGFADDNEKINATHTLERGGVEKILCI